MRVKSGKVIFRQGFLCRTFSDIPSSPPYPHKFGKKASSTLKAGLRGQGFFLVLMCFLKRCGVDGF